ncbi:MAG: hypothetical protein HKO87_09300 [Acidimicrobiia bacterium]|nr:hypothetical protein [Acidimicrobiia bacterium]
MGAGAADSGGGGGAGWAGAAVDGEDAVGGAGVEPRCAAGGSGTGVAGATRRIVRPLSGSAGMAAPAEGVSATVPSGADGVS